MELLAKRFSDANNCSTGLVFVDGVFECYSLEDKRQAVKVAGKTRIPDGRYEVKFRKVISPFTQRYRDKFPWFEWHLELQGVPGFTNIYIHAGNKDSDTEGCLLVGDTINNNRLAPAFLGNSQQAFARLYSRVASALKAGDKVFIKVESEDVR